MFIHRVVLEIIFPNVIPAKEAVSQFVIPGARGVFEEPDRSLSGSGSAPTLEHHS